MPSDHTVNVRTESGPVLDHVRFTFGAHFPRERERRISEGYGFNVELPAVLDLLTAVAEQEMEASDARGILLEAVDVIYDQAGCYHQESFEDKLAWCVRDGGCRICEREREPFARYLAMMEERWRRWTLPQEFPFAAGSSNGLHTVSCGVVRRRMDMDFPARRTASSDREALRAFAHTRDPYNFWPEEVDQLSGYLPFHPMSAEEARVWMAKHTGPKGGRHYRRCQHCAPTP